MLSFLGSVQRQSDPHSVFPGRRTGDIRRCDRGSDYILCICKNKKTKFLADGRHRMCRAGFGTDHRSLGQLFQQRGFRRLYKWSVCDAAALNAVRSSDVTQEMMEHLQTIDGVQYIQVHPTFLYENIWNIGVLLLLLLFTKHKKFDGEIFLLYLAGYGIGRFWIEGLRTDQLLLPGIKLPVSQVLSAVVAIVSIAVILIQRKDARQKNRVKAQKD